MHQDIHQAAIALPTGDPRLLGSLLETKAVHSALLLEDRSSSSVRIRLAHLPLEVLVKDLGHCLTSSSAEAGREVRTTALALVLAAMGRKEEIRISLLDRVQTHLEKDMSMSLEVGSMSLTE